MCVGGNVQAGKQQKPWGGKLDYDYMLWIDSDIIFKPEDFIKIAQSKTPRQINTAWSKLTTKESKPNGRINTDCILLRILDK